MDYFSKKFTMRLGYIYILSFVLLFTFCKKKQTVTETEPAQITTPTGPAPGTQILKIYDADLSSTGTHDNATFFYFYDSNYRINLIKEYDTTLSPTYVVTKINYKEITYTYNSNNNVDVETITSYSPTLFVQTNNYFYDASQRMRKMVVYYNSVYNDSIAYSYLTNKIVSKQGSANGDTIYINSVTQNLDSVHYFASGYVYKYQMDGKVNAFKTHDYALNPYDISPYKCDYNIKKVKTPFGTYNYTYTYNANNYPAFYTTILSTGSGCNVTFYYNN